uniref:Uncharacterized protein n=2 Tax=Avena sativa TaxID=4498 RepID=A0ACD5XSL4_AVESA
MRVEQAMPIALESGARFGRGVPEAAAACGGGSSSAGRDSDSRAEAVHAEEAEDGDGEVQSSLRGPFDTMDALQDALPRRREVSKFYNIKSGSSSNAVDVAVSPQFSKGLANPESPSPKKRKGPPPFGIKQNESQSKELSPVRDDTNSPTTHCRKSLYPAVTSNPPCKSRNSDEHECCKNLPCHCLQRRFSDANVSSSPPAALQTQLISVQMTSVSTVGPDVAESTDVSPREKRRKN